MGQEIIYCVVCGERILHTHIQEGRAAKSGGKGYCKDHLDQAPQEAVVRPADARPRRQTRPITPPPRPGTDRRRTARIQVPPKKSGPGLNVLVGIGSGVVVVIILIFVLSSGGRDPAGSSDTPKTSRNAREAHDQGKPADPPTDTTPNRPRDATPPRTSDHRPDTSPEREAKAKKLLEEIRAYAKEHADDPFSIVTFCRSRVFDVEGTSVEAEVMAVMGEAGKKADRKRASEQIDGLLKGADTAAKGDPGFARRAEITGKFEEALQMALKHAEHRVEKIREAQAAYETSWKKAAEEAVRELVEKARSLAGEKKFDEALLHLNGLPEAFEGSPTAGEIHKARREIEELQAKAEEDRKKEEIEGLKQYVGTYTSTQTQLRIEISVDGKSLRFTVTSAGQGTFLLEKKGEHTYTSVNVRPFTTCAFQVSDGRATGMTMTVEPNRTMEFTRQ